MTLREGLLRLAAAVVRGRSFICPLRLGVRAVVIEHHDDGGVEVMLVRHTYVSGWYLPGGGVESGESAQAALARELVEETGLEMTGAPALHGFFFNPKQSRRGHVACYVVHDFRRVKPHRPDLEIAEARFFPVTALPEGTSPATRARLAEVLSGVPVSQDW